MNIEEAVQQIGPLDLPSMDVMQKKLNSLTKPLGSLGRLESLATQLAGIQRTGDIRSDRKVIFTMAADHGVAAEGVSAYPQEVTMQMVLNFLRGGAAINVLARQAGVSVVVVDMGVAVECPAHPDLVVKRIGPGTRNFLKEPAMTRDQARQSVQAGMEVFEQVRASGVDLVGVGDMGIGNTAASSAITAALTGMSVEQVTSRGTGLSSDGVRRKIEVISRALDMHRPDPLDPLDVLAKVGGFEIGGMAGVMLAAAASRVPVMLDGFIAGAASLIACRMAPALRDYLIASHRSVESGHRVILEALELSPLLDLSLRLGEGTGAALAMPLMDAAVRIVHEMATFESAGVSQSQDTVTRP